MPAARCFWMPAWSSFSAFFGGATTLIVMVSLLQG
jgi:hypothetical protein